MKTCFYSFFDCTFAQNFQELSIDVFLSIIGWVGAGAALYAYVMLSSGRLEANTFQYQGWNLFGAICLIMNTTYNHAYPSAIVNIIWVFVGLYAIVRISKSLKKEEQSLKVKPIRVRKLNRFRKRRA